MVVTKDDVYEKIIFAERPACPHCGQEMKIYQCSETGFSCGSGWGTPYFFICVNDECPPFAQGWKDMKKHYGRTCSCRCICFPESETTEMMMVFSHADCNAAIVDEEVIALDKARGTSEDPAVQNLLRSFRSRDLNDLLDTLSDNKVHYKVRQRAAEFIGELGFVEAIEPLENLGSIDQRIAVKVHDAVAKIHKTSNTRECPFCKEIIQARAVTCHQCGRDLPQKKG